MCVCGGGLYVCVIGLFTDKSSQFKRVVQGQRDEGSVVIDQQWDIGQAHKE